MEKCMSKKRRVDADGEAIVEAEGKNSTKTVEEISKQAQHLYDEGFESEEYTIFDVVLLQPGYDALYPRNERGGFTASS